MASNRHIRLLKFIPAIAWLIIVLVVVCTPRDKLPETKLFALLLFDKAVHVACFGLLVLLFYWPIAGTAASRQEKLHFLTRLTIATIVWGITTELIQRYFVPGRSFDLFDWLADSIGAAAAYLWLRWRLKKQKTQPEC